MESNSSPSQNLSLPPIGVLFSESWQTFTKSLLSLFLLNVLGLAIYIGLAIVAILIFIISGAGSFLLKNGFSGISTALPNITGPIVIALSVIIIVFVVASLLVSSVLQIASIILVNNPGQVPVMDAFKKSVSLIVPLALVGILIFILIVGSLFVFILPVILFYFLLVFAQQEVILNNQRSLEAIKRSVLLVSRHFGAIMVRMLLLALIYLGFSIFTSIIGRIGPETKMLMNAVTFIVNLFIGWFSLSYSITLYKQASRGLENQKGSNIAWMWVVALLGWLLAVGIGFASYKTISSGVLNNAFKKPTSTTAASLQQKESLASPFLKTGDTKLATANQLATKANLSEEDKSQIRGLLSGALADYNTAVEKDPQNDIAWYDRGLAYRYLIGIIENAENLSIASYQKAITLNPSDYNAYLELGGVYYQSKQYDKAIENFQKVVELKPNSANGYFNLGVAYKQVGAKDSARKALEKALELLPKNDPTRYKVESELNLI